jgi:hypothetical protein
MVFESFTCSKFFKTSWIAAWSSHKRRGSSPNHNGLAVSYILIQAETRPAGAGSSCSTGHINPFANGKVLHHNSHLNSQTFYSAQSFCSTTIHLRLWITVVFRAPLGLMYGHIIVDPRNRSFPPSPVQSNFKRANL